MLELSKCKSCGAGVYWLRLAKRDIDPRTGGFAVREVPGSKPNPIDSAPNRKGTLIIDRKGGRLYRFATGNEIETARNSGRSLYISHFETCPYAAAYKTGSSK